MTVSTTVTALAPIGAGLERQARGTVDLVRETLRAASTVDEVMEVRARIEAAKAWAKVHGQVQKIRLDLLRIEVAALVRVIELGGEDLLRLPDRRAAVWLAGLSEAERDELVRDCGQATTAAGMCRAVWADREQRETFDFDRRRGMAWASNPPPPPTAPTVTPEAVTKAVRSILNNYIATGEQFTVNDLAEELLSELNEDVPDGFRDGIKEICNKVISGENGPFVSGIDIPQIITVRVGSGFARIPTSNATVGHLVDMLAFRREQLAAFEASVDRLQRFVDKVRAVPGATDASRVGDLLTAAVVADQQQGSAA